MKSTLISALALAIAFGGFAACKKTTTEDAAGKKLSITQPVNQTLKQGETNKMDVRIDRDKFNDTVDIAVSGLPAGVSASGGPTFSIKPGDEKVELVLVAQPDATLVNDHVATVTASAMGLAPVTQTFKVTVKAK
jgi:hypothetical protein